jgi:PAS domain S-box-containing protein
MSGRDYDVPAGGRAPAFVDLSRFDSVLPAKGERLPPDSLAPAPGGPARVLVEIHDAAEAARLEAALADGGNIVVHRRSDEPLLAAVARLAPDVLILDARRDGAPTEAYLRGLGDELETSAIATLILARSSDAEALTDTLRAGADDFVTAPVDPTTVVMRVRSLARLKATSDALTWHTAQLHDLAEERSAEWRALVDGLPGTVVRLDEVGRIDLVSRPLLGRDLLELQGELLVDLVESPAQRTRLATLVRDALERGSDASIELEVRNRTGTHVALALQIGPIRYRDRIRGAVVFVADVTAQRAAEREQRALAEQLQHAQKLDAIGRLAGSVAHDFNNMLGVVLSYAAMLVDELDEGTTSHEDAKQIVEAARRAEQLTAKLLAMGRAPQAAWQATSLSAVVTGMKPMLRHLTEQGVELELDLESDARDQVYLDVAQFEQVLMNLVVNACDAMPSGGTLRIEVRRSDEAPTSVGPARVPMTEPPGIVGVQRPSFRPIVTGPWVELRVIDSGTGMDTATKARLFEPFFTTKPVGKGTGLGLATAVRTVNQAGGRISVESELGKGSTFLIRLPWHRGVASIRSSAPPPISRRSGRGLGTVLVIDDESSLREIARRTLTRQGYEVLEARDIDEALTHAREHRGPIDLLLSDLVMPGASGPEVASVLQLERPEVRVLFVTGWASDKLLKFGLSESADVLGKPFTPAQLLERVERALSVG